MKAPERHSVTRLNICLTATICSQLQLSSCEKWTYADILRPKEKSHLSRGNQKDPQDKTKGNKTISKPINQTLYLSIRHLYQCQKTEEKGEQERGESPFPCQNSIHKENLKEKYTWCLKSLAPITSRCRPDGVFEVEGFDNGSSDDFISARTSILTGFLNPALESSLTASVCVAEKRPVLRIFGNRDIIEFIWLSNPISKSLSASSRIKTCSRKQHNAKTTQTVKLGESLEYVNSDLTTNDQNIRPSYMQDSTLFLVHYEALNWHIISKCLRVRYMCFGWNAVLVNVAPAQTNSHTMRRDLRKNLLRGTKSD